MCILERCPNCLERVLIPNLLPYRSAAFSKRCLKAAIGPEIFGWIWNQTDDDVTQRRTSAGVDHIIQY